MKTLLRHLTADGTRAPLTPFTRWLAWFLADRKTRTISAESAVTAPEHETRQRTAPLPP